MEKEAIKLLQEAETVRLVNSNLREALGDIDDSHMAHFVLPENMSLIDLEQYMPQRRNFRGEFRTTVLGEAIHYAKLVAEAGSRCFVDMENMRARFIFDLGDQLTPLHCQHTSLLELKKTAAMKTLASINNDSIAQRQMAEWIEDNVDFLSFTNASGDEINHSHVLAAVRNISVEALRSVNNSEQDWASERTAMEKISVKETDNLPKFVMFTCTPYQGLSERTITCRFSFNTRGDESSFKLSIVNHEALNEVLADEFKNLLTEKLFDTEIGVSIGTFH